MVQPDPFPCVLGGELKKKKKGKGGRKESVRGQRHQTMDIDVSIHFQQQKGQCLPCFTFYGRNPAANSNSVSSQTSSIPFRYSDYFYPGWPF